MLNYLHAHINKVFLSIVFIATVWIATNLNSVHNYNYVFHYDSEGYQMYLPALFLNGGFENLFVKTTDLDGGKYSKPYPNTDKVFNKYTCGVSILELPFFLLAIVYGLLFGLDNITGYEPHFSIATITATAFYLTVAFHFLIKILNKHTKKNYVSLVVVSVVWLGTNLFHYTTKSPGLSHPFSIFLFVMFIYFTQIYYEENSLRYLLKLAFIFGLIVLIRPTNAIVFIYFLFYNVSSLKEIYNRFVHWIKHIKHIIFFPVIAFLVFLPQLFYWKYESGSWLIYSYKGEGFIYWKSPMLPEIWYHPQNGFFLYSPLMLLSIFGLALTIKKKHFNSVQILIILLIQSYLCASWSSWNFTGSFGYRPFIEYLAFMAIPMEYMLEYLMLKSGVLLKVISLGSVVFFLFLSVRLSMVYTWPWEGPDWGWDDVLRVYLQALFIN